MANKELENTAVCREHVWKGLDTSNRTFPKGRILAAPRLKHILSETLGRQSKRKRFVTAPNLRARDAVLVHYVPKDFDVPWDQEQRSSKTR